MLNKIKIIGILLSSVMLLNLNVIGANAANGKKVVINHKSKTINKIITKPKTKLKKTKAKTKPKAVAKKTTNTVHL